MKTAEELLPQIQALGDPGIARILKNHGVKEPVWGARIGDMKPLIKGIRSDPALARGLFESGVYDAMYLSALVVNGADLDAETLDRWAQLDYGSGISESTIPWLAVEHPEAVRLAMKWLDSPQEFTAVSGWATWAGLVAMTPDSQLDLTLVRQLLDRAGTHVHTAPNRVRYAMNTFIISVGVYVEPLRAEAQAWAARIGPVEVFLGNTACEVPLASRYIEKTLSRGPVKKRRTMKC